MQEIKCPHCKCDNFSMFEFETRDLRTKEDIYFCNSCGKIFRIETNAIPEAPRKSEI